MNEPVIFTCDRCGAKGDPPKCDHFAQPWTPEQIADAHRQLILTERDLKATYDNSVELAKYLKAEIQKREAAEQALDSLRVAAQKVHDTFQRDEAQGFRSRDRQFVIEILGQALKAQ